MLFSIWRTSLCLPSWTHFPPEILSKEKFSFSSYTIVSQISFLFFSLVCLHHFLLIFKMLLLWLLGTFILATHLLCLWSQLFHGLNTPIGCDSPIYPQVLTHLCTSWTCISACALAVCSWVFFSPQTLNFLFCVEVAVQSLSHVWLFVTLWTPFLSIINSQSLRKLMSIESSDAIRPSHTLSSPPPPSFNLSQQQGLF